MLKTRFNRKILIEEWFLKNLMELLEISKLNIWENNGFVVWETWGKKENSQVKKISKSV